MMNQHKQEEMKFLSMPDLLTVTFWCCALFTGTKVHGQQPTHQWTRTFGNASADGCYGVTGDNAGNVYACGYYTGTVSLETSGGTVELPGSGDIFPNAMVAKLAANGEYLWAKGWGGELSDQAFVVDVDEAGNVYVAGHFQLGMDLDPGQGEVLVAAPEENLYDLFVLKLSNDGDYIWGKHIPGTGWYDFVNAMNIDPQTGNILLVGSYEGTTDFDPGPGTVYRSTSFPGNADIFLLELDSQGDFVDVITIEGGGFDSGTGVQRLLDGTTYVCGIYSDTIDFDPGVGVAEYMGNANPDGIEYADAFLLRLNAENDLEWVRTYGGLLDDWANALAVDMVGNIYVAGMFNGAVDLDPGPGTDMLTSDSWDGLVWKITEDGDYLWSRNIGGSDESWASAIALDGEDAPYCTGYFAGSADFDPSAQLEERIAGAYWEVFIWSLSSGGALQWVSSFTGNVLLDVNVNKGNGIHVGEDFSVVVCGSFESQADVDGGPGVYDILAASEAGYGEDDGFIHKLIQPTTSVNEAVNGTRCYVYPNPNNGRMNVHLGALGGSVEVLMHDAVGKLVYSGLRAEDPLIIDLELDPGVYEVKAIHSSGYIQATRFIAE